MQTSSNPSLDATNQPVTVRFEDVSKRYRLNSGQASLRDVVASFSNKLRHRADSDEGHFWALKNFSFEVHRGEALGLVGPNGAGKTTTLKLLSQITRPTTGKISLDGRFSSLIELGAGFHPDLSGRENVFLNGVILGLTQRQIKDRFDEIVAFSELERFIDMPVKRYSSGMYARLGFAVAAHVDPDIMFVDEVLAVGDASFQQKCYDFLHRYVKGGKTTIFVSHNLYVIEQLCDRVIWVERGQMVKTGSPAEVLTAYLDSQEQRALKASTQIEAETEQIRVTALDFIDDAGQVRDTFQPGEDVIVRMHYQTGPNGIHAPHFVVAVSDAQGGPPLFLASMLIDSNTPGHLQGTGTVRCRFKDIPLRPRAYQVWGEVWGSDRAKLLVTWQRMGLFRVEDPSIVVGRGGIRHLRTDAPVNVPYEWEFDR